MPVRSLLRVFLAVLWLWPAAALAQVEQWQSHMDAGVKAYLENNYTEAEKQFAAAVKKAEQFGPEDPRLATTLNSLAETYRAQGRLEEAEPLHKRALSIREKALGPEHAATAQSLLNLAAVYKAQRRYAEAEQLEQRSRKHRVPTVSADALWQSYIAAGGRAFQQGNYPEAEKQLVAALLEAEVFGPRDPRLATSFNNLALVYQAQGRYIEAEPLYKRALVMLEKTLGTEHPEVARSLNNLAALYQAQGKYDEAEPFYKRALAIREKALGPEHPHVVQSLKNYAAMLRKTGRGEEAEKLEARAKAIRTKHAERNPAR